MKLRTLGLLVVAALALAGCVATPSADSHSTPVAEQVSPALAKFYQQRLAWSSCNGPYTCATAVVPVDWSHPEGATVSLALIRHAATNKKPLGSLFLNPGGPGASGVTFIRTSLDYAVDKTLTDSYDVIGFDPRGIGESDRVTCTDNAKALDEFIYSITPGQRGSASWLASATTEAKAFAAGCKSHSGDLLAHMDSVSVARDLDALRAAVGDQKLNYLGYSYGTFIGGMYAQTFPTKVGHLVLDGAVDPSLNSTDSLIAQAAGFDMALGDWAAWCLTQKDCPFTGSVATAKTQISQILATLEAQPQRGSDGRMVGADTFATAIIAPLYSKNSWKYLTDLFTKYRDGNVDAALSLADWYNERNSDGTYNGNQLEGYTAVSCLDSPASAPSTWDATAERLKTAAPVLGPYFSYGDVLCANWPYPAVLTPAKLGPTGSAPIVVIGTTGDPATPIAAAQSFSAQLQNGRFIAYSGEGHTGYNRGSSCVNALVDAYFVSDQAPAATTHC